MSRRVSNAEPLTEKRNGKYEAPVTGVRIIKGSENGSVHQGNSSQRPRPTIAYLVILAVDNRPIKTSVNFIFEKIDNLMEFFSLE